MDENINGLEHIENTNLINERTADSPQWKSADIEDGHIQFVHKRNSKRIQVILKGLAFVLIASISGGATGAFIANQKLQNQYYDNNPSFREQLKASNIGTDIPLTSYSQVAEEVIPCIVGISTNSEGFLNNIDDSRGSGIIINSSGTILTNYHIIEGASKITVRLSNNKTFNATIVGVDKQSDIAVIKIDSKDLKNLPVAKVGDASKIRVGDIAIAIGNPSGDQFASTVTAGIISATNREIVIPDTITKENTIYKSVFQTDAAINSGNSGGALCNEAGEIIGINCVKISSFYDVTGIGFSESINEAMNIANQLIDGGKVIRPDLGILGETLKTNGGSKVMKGIYVYEVKSGSGAQTAGVKPGDIIIKLDKTNIEKVEDLDNFLSKYKIGDSVVCTVYRDSKTISVNIKLGERKNS